MHSSWTLKYILDDDYGDTNPLLSVIMGVDIVVQKPREASHGWPQKRSIGIGRVAEAPPVDHLKDEGGCTMFKRNTVKSEVIHDMLICPSLASPPLCLSPFLPAFLPFLPPPLPSSFASSNQARAALNAKSCANATLCILSLIFCPSWSECRLSTSDLSQAASHPGLLRNNTGGLSPKNMGSYCY